MSESLVKKYVRQARGSARWVAGRCYRRGLWPCVINGNRLLGNYRKKVWLIGSPRSGTTWVPRLINWDRRYREVFEPFNLFRNVDVQQRYLRPGEENAAFRKRMGDIFDGRPIDEHAGRGNADSIVDDLFIRHRGLLVKDVTVQLLAGWIWGYLPPDVKTVYLIRNPFAVALSKLKKPDWFPADREIAMLSQPKLVQDHLQPHLDLVEEYRNDDFLRKILVWSVENHVFMKQSAGQEVLTVFYEDAVMDPMSELKRIYPFIGEDARLIDESVINRLRATPTRVTSEINTISGGKSPITAWKEELSAGQIDAAKRILARFGYDRLYDADSMPDRKVLDWLMEGNLRL